jgi:lysophospholipid acyltransferase (LPLAT)-like uncharacterized protein
MKKISKSKKFTVPKTFEKISIVIGEDRKRWLEDTAAKLSLERQRRVTVTELVKEILDHVIYV